MSYMTRRLEKAARELQMAVYDASQYNNWSAEEIGKASGLRDKTVDALLQDAYDLASIENWEK